MKTRYIERDNEREGVKVRSRRKGTIENGGIPRFRTGDIASHLRDRRDLCPQRSNIQK